MERIQVNTYEYISNPMYSRTLPLPVAAIRRMQDAMMNTFNTLFNTYEYDGYSTTHEYDTNTHTNTHEYTLVFEYTAARHEYV